MQTSVYPDDEVYKKAQKIFTIMELQGKEINLTKFLNEKLKEFVEENKDLLEKAEKFKIDNDNN